MKKIIASALAASMVLSMASVAFAATTLNVYVDPAFGGLVTPVEWNKSEGEVRANAGYTDGVIGYGDTAYFPIYGKVVSANSGSNTAALVYQSDAVKGLKLKPTYDLGASLVSKTSVVKKKLSSTFVAEYNTAVKTAFDTTISGGRNYAYFIAVETKSSNSTSAQYISGKVEMSKNKTSGQNYGDKLEYDTNRLAVDLTVKFLNSSEDTGADGLSAANYVNDKKHVYKFNEGNNGLAEDEEQELVLIGDDIATFTFNSYGQGKLVLAADNDFIADIAVKFPSANLDFVTLTASASFNKIGTLRIFAEEGKFLYSVGADGTLTPAKATYDSTDEAYLIKTRTIGSYVVSDQKLDLGANDETVSDVTPEAPSVVAPINPGTGAAC